MPANILLNTSEIFELRKKFRVKLLGNFLLIGFFSAAFQLIVNIFDDTAISIYTELSFAAILGILYILNLTGHFKIARPATFIIVNLALFFSFRIEPTSGIQYYYFPMVLLAFVLYNTNDWVKAVLFCALPYFLVFFKLL